MEYIILIIFLLLMLIILKIVCKVNIKELKTIGENKELDQKVSKYPENIEICKKILKKIGNESVKIEEDKKASNCLYMVATNKILIGDVKQSFTRIQTIAHECLHSIQDKRMLMFNYIYSNIYIITFIILCILAITDILKHEMLFISTYIIMSFTYYFIRSYLENDAMIKAKFLAEQYMEDEQISDEQEIRQIINEYDKINNIGIKATNYNLLFETILKNIILTILIIL